MTRAGQRYLREMHYDDKAVVQPVVTVRVRGSNYTGAVLGGTPEAAGAK